MSHKKYYGYKKPQERHSIKFRDDAANSIVGTMFAIGYQDEKFYMVKVNWGAEDDWERSRDGEVEMRWCKEKEIEFSYYVHY